MNFKVTLDYVASSTLLIGADSLEEAVAIARNTPFNKGVITCEGEPLDGFLAYDEAGKEHFLHGYTVLNVSDTTD